MEEKVGLRERLTRLFFCRNGLTKRDMRNMNLFRNWLLGWGLTYLTTMHGLVKGWLTGSPAQALGLSLSILVGVGACRAYLRFLREADELLRQIQLEGLALGFGVGALFMMSYGLAERMGAPKLETGDPVTLMMLSWALGQALAARRYR